MDNILEETTTAKSFPTTAFDTTACRNKYATNQYFHFMKKHTKDMFGCPC
jgi:hypothetical protein